MRVRNFIIIATAALVGFPGCFSFQPSSSEPLRSGNVSTVVIRQPINELEREVVPGTVNDLWVEPMIDQVRVPGQIDAKGVYYRPSHNTLAEIRHGRFQKVQYPDEYAPGGNNVSDPGNDRVVTPNGVEQR